MQKCINVHHSQLMKAVYEILDVKVVSLSLCVIISHQVDKDMRLLQGAIFYTPGQTSDEFWDVEADKKFEVSMKKIFLNFDRAS